MTELCLSVGYKISQPGPEGSSRSGSSCRCLGPFRVIRATEVLFVCSHLISFMKQRALLHFCRSKASRRGAMRVVSTLVLCAVFQILPKAPTRSVFEALPDSLGKEPPPGNIPAGIGYKQDGGTQGKRKPPTEFPSAVCVGITYLPVQSPAKYCRRK